MQEAQEGVYYGRLFTVTTESGLVYEISRTVHQDVVVKWEDPEGDPMVKGDAIKVWEHCQITCLNGNGKLVVGQPMHIDGLDRYTWRKVEIGRTTSPITKVEDHRGEHPLARFE